MAEDNFQPSIASDLAIESVRRGQYALKDYFKYRYKDFPDWRDYRKAKLKTNIGERFFGGYTKPLWRKLLQPLGAGFPIEDWAAYKGIKKYAGPLAKAGSKILGPLQFMTPGKAMAPDLTEEEKIKHPLIPFGPFERGR